MLDFSRVPYLQLPLPERGRPGPRLLRGLFWAAVAIFVISILAFAVGQIIAADLLEYIALDSSRSIGY